MYGGVWTRIGHQRLFQTINVHHSDIVIKITAAFTN
jgi:hypothetical protein